MVNPTTITSSVKIGKYDDASGFDFYNNTGDVIPAGSEIRVGGLVGVTTSPIPTGACGTADFICGPTTAFRMYLDSPLSSDVDLGDEILHPVTGESLGYAIYRGRLKPSHGINPSTSVALTGENCVYFVARCVNPACCNPDGGGGTVTPPDTECVVVIGLGGVPNPLPISNISGDSVIGINVYVPTVASDSIDLDAFLASLDASTIGDGYKLKFQNTGDGQICKTADVTGDAICFNKNEFVCLEWCNGQWQWT